MTQRHALVFAGCLLLTATSSQATMLTPTETVRAAVDSIIVVLRDDALGRDDRWQRIGLVIRRNFDFQSMSQSVLATNWRSATPAQQAQFVDYFSEYLENTYRDKIEAYDNQRIRVLDETIRGNRAVVETVIVAGEREIPVDYRLRSNGSQWLAYDVMIEGVSLVNSYRTTFDAIVQTEGVNGLIGDLQGRIDAYKAKRDSSPSETF